MTFTQERANIWQKLPATSCEVEARFHRLSKWGENLAALRLDEPSNADLPTASMAVTGVDQVIFIRPDSHSCTLSVFYRKAAWRLQNFCAEAAEPASTRIAPMSSKVNHGCVKTLFHWIPSKRCFNSKLCAAPSKSRGSTGRKPVSASNGARTS
jgi:hypothetical protein